MKTPLRILHLEDDPNDVVLIRENIIAHGIEVEIIDAATRADFVAALEKGTYDLILADYSLPSFDGLSALSIVKEKFPDLPFIFVTGALGEEQAVETLTRGATDYVLKHNLVRLVPAVNRALKESLEKTERRLAKEAIRKSEEKYRNIFENIQDVYYETALDGTITEVSPSIEAVTGGQYTRDDLIGKSMLDFYANPKMRETLLLILKEHGNVRDFEIILKNRDGSLIPCSISAILQYDADGKPMKLVGSLRNITERKQAEDALRESEERFRMLVESAPEAIFVQSQGYFVYLNPAMLRLFGASTPEELLGKEFMERIAPEYHEAIRKRIRMQRETGKPAPLMEQEYLRMDGSMVPVETTAVAVWFQERDAHLVFVRDVTDRKRTEEEMKKLIAAVEHSADWILMTDREGTIEYANKAVEKISGYTKEELIGKNPRIFKSGKHNREFFKELWETILSGNTFSAILINRKKTGELFELHYTITPLKDNEGNVHHFVATAKDITEQKLLEERLDYMAYYDSLTGLPNKRLFADRLVQSLASAEQRSISVAVLFVDIDRFTSLNETYGYETGDEILKEAGRRLSHDICRDCTVGRIDADKFGMILVDIQHSEDVILAMEKMQSAFKKPLRADREDIIITLSAGIALFPGDGKEPEVLMQNAEVALTKAKTGGINMYQFFTAEMNKKAIEFIRLQRHLFNALELNEFVMHYQPYFDSITREMVGMEALIRWNSREFGLVSPGLFIPILEETGMIIDVGKWIIQTVCRQIKEWMDKGYKSSIVPVYVNLSLAQFAQRDLSDFIVKTIGETGIYPSFLGFEITESIFMQDIQHTQAVLNNLRQRGISVNIDDFGTGYSSLSNLKRLPVNNLKIDISFIRDVTNNPDDASIVITIISMAHNLNLKTIAEGVETEEQWKILRILKCDMVQGYYFSKPVPVQDVEKFFRQ